jgi:hypothetical protein
MSKILIDWLIGVGAFVIVVLMAYWLPGGERWRRLPGRQVR